jgi:RND family efflux transporter MFP subunit
MQLWADHTFELLLYPDKDVMVSSPLSGVLQSVKIREGERVQKNDILAELNSDEEELEIKRLKKVVEKRSFDNKGYQNLLKDDMTSKNEAMQALVEKEISILDLKKMEMRKSKKSLKSPIKGVVVKSFYEAGEWLRPGDNVFQIINTDKIKAHLMIRQEHSETFTLGKKFSCRFRDFSSSSKIGHRSFEGSVVFVDSRFDLSSGLKLVKIEILNHKGWLMPGMRGELKVESQ